MNNEIKSLTISVDNLLMHAGTKVSVVYGEDSEDPVSIVLSEGRTLVVPDYQRAIRWGKKQVTKLIADISESDKFLGSILFSKNKGRNKYEIIDGQQRITVLLLIIKYVCDKRNLTTYKTCGFENNSYKYFDYMAKYEFNYELLPSESDPTKESLEEFDALNQTEDFRTIWKIIESILDEYDSSKLKLFFNRVLASTVNLTINSVPSAGALSKTSCIYHYLDVNNDSLKLDKIDILKAHLFRDHYELFINNWGHLQKEVTSLQKCGVVYDFQTFFYHYFLCRSNQYLNWSLKGLSDGFETANANRDKSIEPNYANKSYISDIIKDDSFYDSMVNELKGFVRLIKNVVKSEGVTDEFKELFSHAGINNITLKNIFFCMKAILSNDDKVPKMLLMKYYLYVLVDKNKEKSVIKSMYNIYFCSIMFTASATRKNSKFFSSHVLDKDWYVRISEQASTYFDNLKQIRYDMKISRYSFPIETCGQEYPRHLFAIKEFFNKTNELVDVSNERSLCEFLSNRTTNTMEHFFLNQTRTIKFSYGPKNKKNGTYTYPNDLFKSYVCMPLNYLVLDENANNFIGNVSVPEKIIKIAEWELKHPKKQAWKGRTSEHFYEIAKDIYAKSKCPSRKDLEAVMSEEEAVALFDEYFDSEEGFKHDMNEYISRISVESEKA